MSERADPAVVIDQVACALAALPVGSAVIGLGGAHAKGQVDIHSDIDFYVFGAGIPPIEDVSEDVLAQLPGAQGLSTWSHAGEGGLDIRLNGNVVEIWFRDIGAIMASAERVLDGHFEKEDRVWTPNGFYGSTALADLASMQVLTCRDPEFTRLLESIAAYPESMRKAAFNAGLAPQRFWNGNMHLHTAIARADGYYLESILHQTRAGLIQAAFALNRKYFSGDKKMALTLGTLPNLPDGFAASLLEMKSPATPEEWRARFDDIFAAGDQLCAMMAKETA